MKAMRTTEKKNIYIYIYTYIYKKEKKKEIKEKF